MRLAKASATLLAVLAISFCLVPGAWAQGKPAKKTAHKAKAAGAKAAAKAEKAAPGGATKTEPIVAKRDPFLPLINIGKTGGPDHLPPGKAGLVISTTRVDGTVKAPSGMIAVVSNPEQRVYFVREGDRLYDGEVEKIAMDGVTFREHSKDAFGKPIERIVTKRIYASAGEQQ